MPRYRAPQCRGNAAGFPNSQGQNDVNHQAKLRLTEVWHGVDPTLRHVNHDIAAELRREALSEIAKLCVGVVLLDLAKILLERLFLAEA